MLRFLALALALTPTLRAADPAVTATKGTDTVVFKVGGEHATEYKFGGTVQVEKGEGTKPLAKPYFWPLYAPGNVPVTRAWPMVRSNPGETTDHFHQKSVWFCHGDVIPEGVELKTKSANKHVAGANFWDETPNHGVIACVEVGDPKAVTANHVAVPTRNEWRTPDGDVILTESRTLHLLALPAGRLLVFDIDLTAAVPVTFGDTKEGSMGVRVHDALRTVAKNGGTVTSSTGKTAATPAKDNLPVWGEVADWHDYSGTVDGKPAGLAVFADPSNGVPSAWHTRAYGLMAANPFGRGGSGFPSQKGKTDLVKLAKGDHLKLRFGVYAHTGDATTGKVVEAYRTFLGK